MADEHYGTIVGADNYNELRGNAAWADGDTATKTAALIRASVVVDGMGRTRMPDGRTVLLWRGTKTGGRAQLRDWPRTDATDSDGAPIDPTEVPIEVEQATYEAALRELIAPGSLSPDYVASQIVKREKVDVIETEYAVAVDGGPASVRPVVSVISDLLAPLLSMPVADIGIFVV